MNMGTAMLRMMLRSGQELHTAAGCGGGRKARLMEGGESVNRAARRIERTFVGRFPAFVNRLADQIRILAALGLSSPYRVPFRGRTGITPNRQRTRHA
jgi:hypothetical protein